MEAWLRHPARGGLLFFLLSLVCGQAGQAAESDHVSVIMAVWNGARYLPESIGSVLSQTHRNWDLYVANDGSTDDTGSTLDQYAALDSRIHVIHLEQNVGLGAARNAALKIAYSSHHGYVALLDCDDWWFPHKLEKQVRFMRERGVALGYTSFQAWESGRMGVSYPIRLPPRVTYSDLLWFTYIGVPTVMLDTDRTGEVFFPPVRRMEDARLWNQITRRGFVAEGLDESLALYRLVPNSLSGQKPRMARERIKMLQEEGLGSASIATHMVFYGIRGLWKHKVEYRPRLPCPLALRAPARGAYQRPHDPVNLWRALFSARR